MISCFGEKCVFVISIDDKAKVPIGVTAATKQAPLMMHVSYKVCLPDHDFVKATKYKLNPSVYAGCEIQCCSAYAEPDHESSTAYTHGRDLRKLIHLAEFVSIVKDKEGFIKPVGVLLCDGGTDENSRFPKTLDAAIQNFKESNLNVLLICTLAPGMSAYNNVERRMAPLSKALSGVLLPHDTCGSHVKSLR